jgi:micrococcal nuclease
MYTYKAKIVKVFDGDTCTAVLDLGCHISVEKVIRLYGIDAPEVRGETKLAGLESRDFLSAQILNKDIYIQTFKDKTEKYGRLLGKLYMVDPSSGDVPTVNEQMVSSGHATTYME